MEKKQKAALIKHIQKLTAEYAEKIKPPEKPLSKKVQAIGAAIQNNFGCHEQSVFKLVEALTGEDLSSFKAPSCEVTVPVHAAVTIVEGYGPSLQVGEVCFITDVGGNNAIALKTSTGERSLAFDYKKRARPATAAEIKDSLTDDLAQKIVTHGKYLFA